MSGLTEPATRSTHTRSAPRTVRRGEAVVSRRGPDTERVLRRARYLIAVAQSPALAGPPIALGRRARIRFGVNGSLTRGPGLVLGEGFVAVIDGPMVVGADVFVGRDATVAVYAGLTIGDGCRFGERVSIHDEDHLGGPSAHASEYLVSPVTIGRRVWVGANAVILRGVSIGDDAVIAAGAVVRSDVPAGALAAGVPARVVRARGGPLVAEHDL